jgi:hypothetical protein
MGQKLLPRQKRFAELIQEGKPISTAYVEAGYKHDKHWGNPYRLYTGNDRVQEYISDLERRALEQHDIDVHKLVNDLQEAMDLARKTRNPGAMIQAAMAQAKLCGLVVDKREVSKSIDRMDMDEVIAEIRNRMGDKANEVLKLLGLDNHKAEPEKPTKTIKLKRTQKGQCRQ